MAEVVRAATEADYPELLPLLETCFGTGTGPDFERIITLDPWRDPENTRVLIVDGHVASHVQVHYRPVRFGCAQAVMGGIGHVGTHPDFRKRGYSTRLLNDCIRLMERKGYHLSLLFTGINDFYAKDGWRTIPTERFSVAATDVPIWDEPAVCVRPYGGDDDREARRAIYDTVCHGWLGALRRTPLYWQRQPKWARLEGADEDARHSLMAEVGGRAVGYAAFRPLSGHLCFEFAALPGCDAAARAMVCALARQTVELGGDLLHFDLPPGTQPHRILADAGVPIELGTSRHYMYRVIDLAGLLNALAPEFAVRLQEADRAGGRSSFVLDIESHRAAVTIDRARVHAHPTTSAPDVCVTQQEFLRALHGYDDGRAALDAAGSGLPHNPLGVLFPRGVHVYAAGDHF